MLILIFIIGLILGSFLNVCIYRIPRGESISYPPSHCTNCNNNIKWYDLIPVISYIFLRGKCRHCKAKISVQYPLIELLNGIIYLLIYIKFGLSHELIKYCILASLIIVIGIIDLKTTDIYDSTIIFGVIAGIIFIGFGYYLGGSILNYITGALLAGGLLSLIILLTKGMGWGDAEFCFVCGLFLGFKLSIIMLFLAFVIGGVISIFLMLLKIKSRKDYIPFGPFIALAAIISILLGSQLINWYMFFML